MTTRPVNANGDYYEEAHKKFLEGSRNQNQVSRAALNASIEALTEAVAMTNGKYARALAELAYMKVVAVNSGLVKPEDSETWLEEALSASEAAVRLQGHDYITYWVKGFVLCNTGNPADYAEGMQSWAKAEELFKHQTDPSDRRSGFRIEYAEQLVFAGKQEEAERHVEAALRIPDWFRWIAAFVYYHNSNRLEEALTQLDMIEKPDELFEIHFLRSAIFEKIIEEADPGDDISEFEKASIESMKKFAEVGVNFLKSEIANGKEVTDKHVEKIFLKEFEDSGYLNDSKTDVSLAWRRNLANAYLRSRDENSDLLDTDYMNNASNLANAINLKSGLSEISSNFIPGISVVESVLIRHAK